MRAIVLGVLFAIAGCAPAAEQAPSVLKTDEVDYSCKTAADCAVKNVGSCCGYTPACVNKDSPTFPEKVKAECSAKGMSSICGFRDIAGCDCVENRCTAQPGIGGAAGDVQKD